MAQLIQLKRSATSGSVPTTAQLSLGEVAINTYDGKLFIKQDNGTETIKEIGNSVSTIGELTDVDLVTTAPTAGQTLKFDGTNWVPGDDINGGVSLVENDYTATADQTAFVISGKILSYVGAFVNGIKVKSSDFTISDDGTDTTVTFGTGLNENDWLQLVEYN